MTQRQPAFDEAQLDTTARRLGLRNVILFGSHATGSPPPGPESDLDVAITLGTPEPPGFWECHSALGAVFPDHSLDLVLLRDADPLFRWEIMRAAVLLWGDIDEFLELRAFAYRDFVDSADLRALERTLSERKLAHIQELIRAAS